ncbi:MAG: hypothetical protein IJT59_03680 [Desulfovibrionaceae bacterium]|nr:hypothetical protein [Desulfovibrionaceae bacterium]
MIIREKRPFFRGSLMLISFFVLLFIIFMPIFPDENGKGLTGLQYSDNVFNQLSKGSSYFIPAVIKRLDEVDKSNVSVTVTLKKAEFAQLAAEILRKSGATEASSENAQVRFSGNLKTILLSAAQDGDALYHNNGKAVSDKYDGQEPLKVATAWWYTLSPTLKELQKQHLIREAEIVDQVIRRAVEPGNNFYSIKPIKVSDNILLLFSLLAFYLIYTLWYGFSIFELFEGVGLAMTKGKKH